MVKWILAFFSFVMTAPAMAQTVYPWSEAVISVRDIEKASALFVEVGNWQIVREGKIEPKEIAYWQLPSQATGEYRYICAPMASSGCLRFVRIDNAGPQMPIRLALRAWDTGGIFSIMVRSDNVPQLFQDAIAMGWWAESRPIRFQFGTSDLRNVVLTGPHGINLAVYERISPDFTAFPVGRISEGFNSMRMVKDKAKARAFYEDQLGFGLLFDSASEPIEPAPSNFGIPLNYTPDIKRSAAALQPQPGETGRVEVMQIDGFTGLDVSSEAQLPNLGIISVRYPVDDLDSYRRKIEERKVKIAYSGTGIRLGVIGEVNIFAVRDPDGSLTEFYEPTDCDEK